MKSTPEGVFNLRRCGGETKSKILRHEAKKTMLLVVVAGWEYVTIPPPRQNLAHLVSHRTRRPGGVKDFEISRLIELSEHQRG